MRFGILSLLIGVASGAFEWQLPRHHASGFGEEHEQLPLGGGDHDDVDIVTGSQFNGLRTYAELPYLNCFSDTETKDYKYDIAVMGAPHDTVSADHIPLLPQLSDVLTASRPPLVGRGRGMVRSESG
jgi:hypothetical protein